MKIHPHLEVHRPPLSQQLAELVLRIIQEDSRAQPAVAAIIFVATVMACQLSREQRAAIAQHMRREADALTGQLH